MRLIMHISDVLSNKIKNMGIVCAMLVVCIHVDWPTEVKWSWTWIIDCFFERGISQIAVPFFFVVSGFFLSGHFDEPHWWKREVVKRIKSLLIPYVVWSVVMLGVLVLMSVFADVIAHRAVGTSVNINSRYVVAPFRP